MKPLKIALTTAGIALILLTAAFIGQKATSKQIEHQRNKETGFAVLELFTSEGCSSCPPAEAVLARIQEESENKPIYLLSYHVDYWNKLGWKDRFSSPQYSKRQEKYNHQFSGQIYTPQVIINGKSEFIGSDRLAINSNIADALKAHTIISLSLQGEQQHEVIDLKYKLHGYEENIQLLIAIVQKHAMSNIKAGENEGRKLSHVQIVRQLSISNLTSETQGNKRIQLPKDFNEKDWEIIGLVQYKQTGIIAAATRATLTTVAAAL